MCVVGGIAAGLSSYRRQAAGQCIFADAPACDFGRIPVKSCGGACVRRTFTDFKFLCQRYAPISTADIYDLRVGRIRLSTSVFVHKCRLPVWLNLPLTWICGRMMYFVTVFFALRVLHLEMQGMTTASAAVWTAVTTGVPGILLQAVVVPILVAALKKARLITYAPRFGKL